MAESSKRRSRRSRSSDSTSEPKFGSRGGRAGQPILVIATDVCLWLTILAVAIGFGGRMASGQVALIIGASLTALCWLLHQLTTSERRYTWTGSEFFWCAGILIGVAQIVPLPTDLLLKISPRIKEILPFWFDNTVTAGLPAKWNQLSLAPWETASAIAVFVAYGIMFLVVAQRIRTIKDVEQMLCNVSLATVVMMLFAQIQFFTSNGKFFWVYDHPRMSTETYPLGCFTNRNHLAQFMALGTGPLIWWLLRRFQQQQLDRSERKAMPATMHSLVVSLLISSLVGVALTALMTLSRGGFLAIGLASFVVVAMLCRVGLASFRFVIAVLIAGSVTGIIFSQSKFESILADRLDQNTGRSEIWMANIKVAADFPVLGTGLGTHADTYYLRIETKRDDGLEYTHAESGYLQVASETGLAGLTLALLVIATSFWWCLGALWNSDTKVTSAAAPILASLVANVAHAVGDFFWYTPVCMLILAVQLACASRLYRLTRQQSGRFVFSCPLPRFVTAIGICALIPVTLWMFDLRWPAALAEHHHLESLLLAKIDEKDLSVEDQKMTSKQRINEILLAAKLNPRDAKLQEAASDAYTLLFDLKQEDTDTAMSLLMLRDTVKTSEFESPAAANKWLQVAVGGNLKILHQAGRALKRALTCSPLRAKSYVQLAELSFVDRSVDPKFQERCLMQSLKLRPNDADTMYQVGKLRLEECEIENTLKYWRPAFERSPRVQQMIASILAPQVEPQFFQKEFSPLDHKALQTVALAFSNAGRTYEAHQVERLYVRQAMLDAKEITSDEELELLMISARNACRDVDDLETAVQVLTRAAKRLPQSYPVRYLLSLDLIASNRAADAAEHLKWCTHRRPDDMGLRNLAAQAVTERLKHTPSTARKDGDVEQK